MEKSNTESKYVSDGLLSKPTAGNKVTQGKIYPRNQAMDSNMQTGANQQRRIHNSRLDAMKRQFHKKVSRQSAVTPQKTTPNSSSRKANAYLQASENEPQVLA